MQTAARERPSERRKRREDATKRRLSNAYALILYLIDEGASVPQDAHETIDNARAWRLIAKRTEGEPT